MCSEYLLLPLCLLCGFEELTVVSGPLSGVHIFNRKDFLAGLRRNSILVSSSLCAAIILLRKSSETYICNQTRLITDLQYVATEVVDSNTG